jgi:hypothetical protein
MLIRPSGQILVKGEGNKLLVINQEDYTVLDSIGIGYDAVCSLKSIGDNILIGCGNKLIKLYQ